MSSWGAQTTSAGHITLLPALGPRHRARDRSRGRHGSPRTLHEPWRGWRASREDPRTPHRPSSRGYSGCTRPRGSRLMNLRRASRAARGRTNATRASANRESARASASRSARRPSRREGSSVTVIHRDSERDVAAAIMAYHRKPVVQRIRINVTMSPAIARFEYGLWSGWSRALTTRRSLGDRGTRR